MKIQLNLLGYDNARGIMMVGCFLVQGDCRALRARNDNYWCFGVVLCKEIATSSRNLGFLAKTRFLYFITANPFLPANTETGCRHRRIAVLYLALILQFSGEER